MDAKQVLGTLCVLVVTCALAGPAFAGGGQQVERRRRVGVVAGRRVGHRTRHRGQGRLVKHDLDAGGDRKSVV